MFYTSFNSENSELCMMNDIYIQEFLVMIFTGADVQPYGLNHTSSLKFTVMLEIEKSGHAKK